jgi:hypothetical protein
MAGTGRPSPDIQTPFTNAILKKGSSQQGPKNTSGSGSENRGTK